MPRSPWLCCIHDLSKLTLLNNTGCGSTCKMSSVLSGHSDQATSSRRRELGHMFDLFTYLHTSGLWIMIHFSGGRSDGMASREEPRQETMSKSRNHLGNKLPTFPFTPSFLQDEFTPRILMNLGTTQTFFKYMRLAFSKDE